MIYGLRDGAVRDLFLVTFQKWETTMRAAFSCCTAHELAEMENTSAMQRMYSHTMLAYDLHRISAEQFEQALSRLITAMEKELVEVSEIVSKRDAKKHFHNGAFVQRAAKA